MKILLRLISLFHKELLQLLQEPKGRASLIVPPFMQLMLLGYAVTLDLKNVDFAVLDYSRTPESREVKAAFDGSPTFIRHPDLASETEMRSKIANREIRLAVVIPADFAQALAGHSKPCVQVIVDGRNASSAGMAMNYASTILRDFSVRRVETGKKTENAFRVETRAWFNPNFDMKYFMVPSLLVMIALIDVLMISSMSIAREREYGTFDQLRMTPYATWEILFAKGGTTLLVSSFPVLICLLGILFWFRIPFNGSWLLLTGLLVTFLSASISIGLLVSSLTRTLQQSFLSLFLVIVPFSMLSGMGTPLESMPEGFQKAMLINPLRHGIEALPRIFLENVTFWEISHVFFFLISIALGAFTMAFILFSRQR